MELKLNVDDPTERITILDTAHLAVKHHATPFPEAVALIQRSIGLIGADTYAKAEIDRDTRFGMLNRAFD